MKLHFLKISICKSMCEKKWCLKNSTDINFSVLLKHKLTVASFNDMTQQHNTGKVHYSLCLKISVMWQGIVNKNREAIRTWIHTSLENMFQRSWYRRCLASNRLTNTLASSSCRWNKEILIYFIDMQNDSCTKGSLPLKKNKISTFT